MHATFRLALLALCASHAAIFNLTRRSPDIVSSKHCSPIFGTTARRLWHSHLGAPWHDAEIAEPASPCCAVVGCRGGICVGSGADLCAGARSARTAQRHHAVACIRPACHDADHSRFRSYDPAKLIAAVAKPVLILQGRRDIQVGVADAERLKEAAPKAELVLLPDANHVLKSVTSDDPRVNAATYADPSLPLAQGVAETIASFVAAASK